jgi:probable rRNA maturation factor
VLENDTQKLPMSNLNITIQFASTHQHLPSKSQLRKWAKAALRVDTDVTIRIVDAQEALELNSQYRGKDYATNVLTFPLSEEPHLMGDIIICAPVVAAEASAQNKDLMAHYAHLTVHGMLHLCGFDHETEPQAELMESIEIQILAKLGYANPYLITEDA